MEESKEYYVYVLLNPFKPGKFVYEGVDFVFDYEPYYVGRGKNDRYIQHYKRNEQKRYKSNKNKYHLINKIKREGEYKFYFLYENLSESNSNVIEIEIISKIGRKYLNEGPLLNATNGGEGVSGYTWTDDQRKLYSERMSGEGNPFYGKTHSKETMDRMRKNNLERWGVEVTTQNEEVKEKLRKPKKFKNGVNPKKGIGRPDLTEESLNSIKEKLYVPIIQKSLDGILIREWKSAKHVFEELGFKPNAINNCLRGRNKTSCGFIWEYLQ